MTASISRWKTLLGYTIVCAVSACSGQNGTAPGVPTESKQAAATANAVTGCTNITDSNGVAYTATVVLTGTQRINVDATGCNLGVYVPPNANAHISGVTVKHANTFQVYVDNATLTIDNSTVTNLLGYHAIVAAVATLTITGSNIRQDAPGSEDAVFGRSGTITIKGTSITYGANQIGVDLTHGSLELDNSNVTYKPSSTSGINPGANAIDAMGATLNVTNGTITVGGPEGVGILSSRAPLTVSNTLISGNGASFGLSASDSTPVNINDTTSRMTGSGAGMFVSCSFGCTATIDNSASIGDGTPGSIGYELIGDNQSDSFFTLSQDVSRGEGTGYVLGCNPAFSTLAQVTTYLTANGDVAKNDGTADAIGSCPP